jgi:myo-inositol 2-dehydrogenase/D-chiro-inositol 1-dehydrogenase
MTKSVNVGLIGAGRIGRVHAENLAYRIPSVNLATVTDIIADSAKQCAADYQIPSVAESPQAIFEDDSIDAVIICSSTDTHAPFITQAAQAGKHIFCEKPIALDLAKIDTALAAVEQSGVKLQLGFNRRFDSNFKAARDMVAAGKIGTPHIVHIISRDPAPPPIEYIKVSGGLFIDQTIHDFDMARYLIDDEVEEIYAAGGVMVDPAIGDAGDIDTAVITLRYTGGAIGTIDNSRKAVYGYDQRVEVFGSEGAVVVSNDIPHTAVHFNAESVQSAKPLYFFLERYMDAYLAEMKVFVDCILQDTSPPVTGIDGRIPVVMGQAAWKSYRENRPVKLDEVDK